MGELLISFPFSHFSGALNQNVSITFIKQHPELIDIEPPVVRFDVNNPANATFNILGLKPGSVDISASAQPNETWMYVKKNR